MWIAAVALMDLTHFEDDRVSCFPMVTQLREKQDLHILLSDSETQALSTYYCFAHRGCSMCLLFMMLYFMMFMISQS